MTELPRPLPWIDRVGSMPYIKGGGDAQLESLRTLLQRVQQAPMDPDTIQDVDRARPRGFVERAARGLWTVTEAGRMWLDSADDAFLMGVFHSEIRFVGELLEQLESSQLTHSQLVGIAKDEFDLPWTSMDQVRRRTTWFRVTGFVELRYDNYLEITEAGRALLHRLINVPPKSARQEPDPKPRDVVLPDPSPRIKSFLSSFDQLALQNRKRLIGYVPGGSSIEAIRTLTSAALPSISRNQWVELCADRYDLQEASALQALGSFRNTGLLEQTSKDGYVATELAQVWLDSDGDLDLVRVIHGHIRFVGELLALLSSTGSAAELNARALTYKIPPPDLQRRIGMFIAAGLVEEAGIRRFRLTPTGEALIPQLPLENTPVQRDTADDDTQTGVGDDYVEVASVAGELRQSARASNDYKRFERAIAAALQKVGFSVEHISGPGRTDVRAVSPLSGDHHFILIADAKTSAKGQVAPFDVVTLREHKEQHGADYVIAVGETFSDKRTADRAKTEGVGLLTVETLCELLVLADAGHVGTADLRKVFAMVGNIAPNTPAKLASASKRISSIATSVLSALATEAAGNDEVTGGELSSSEIYVLLRGQSETPSLTDIQTVLDLLSGPLIRGVASKAGKYALCEHAPIIAARLRNLGTALSGATNT